MASSIPRKFKTRLTTSYDMSGVTTLKAMLINATGMAAYNQATNEFASDFTANELSDASYARQTLTSVTIAENAGGHEVRVTSDAATWSALAGGEVAAGIVIVDTDTGVDATSPVWAVLDNADLTTNGSDVTFTPNATDGIIAWD